MKMLARVRYFSALPLCETVEAKQRGTLCLTQVTNMLTLFWSEAGLFSETSAADQRRPSQ